MFRNRSTQRKFGKKSKRHASSLKGVTRRASFEPLESRNLFSVTLPTIANQTLSAGAPLHYALTSTGTSNAVSYTVSVNNGNVTAAVPTGNTYLKFHVEDTADGINGDMIFQLFNDLTPDTVAKITSLVNSNFYNGLTFHRIIDNFMIQGGDPKGDGTGGPGYSFDDEFNTALQFTSPGLLAMANSGSDTNGSQFFITDAPYRSGDFKYSIFGFLVQGDSVRSTINNVPTGTNDKPTHTVTITSASIVTDTQDAVLRLSAANGTTGTSVVTVTARDTITNETSVQQFTVTVNADTTNDPPFLTKISPIQTRVNTPVTIDLSAYATDAENSTIYYTGAAYPSNSKLTVTVNSSTGVVTITPAADLPAGIYSVKLAVSSSASSSVYDTQVVPVYISPAAPTSIQLLAASDTGSSSSDLLTKLNNTTGNTLQFQVNGVLAGATVQLYADGTLIGEGTVAAGATTVVITTNGTFTLTDGSHAITAKQTLKGQSVKVGNLSTTTDLASIASSSLTINVDTVSPLLDFTPITTASIGVAYHCLAAVNGAAAGTITYELTQSPADMTVDSSTGLIAWQPPTGQTSPVTVVLKATDKAGNTSEKTYSISIVAANNAPIMTTSASPNLGTVSEDGTAVVIDLTTFINNGSGTTQIQDSDTGAIKGGIALTGVVGKGKWEFSLDGTNYTTITSVSASSALLLPKDAKLRYTPDAKNGETASITYRAWDTTAGTSGGRINLSMSVLYGTNTAFSVATDTASLTVTPVNDAPVLTAVQPSMGNTDFHKAKVISLTGSFINNGTGSTVITDEDSTDVVGGIAIFGVTGLGTWEYSLNGTDYTALGTVSNSSALLLPKDAKLRYTPNGTNTESPTVSYCAWDRTSGTSGTKVNISASGSVGGVTAFSSLTDIATLAVIDQNDAPVLGAANPSLGTTTEDAAFTISLTDSFINHNSGTTTVTDADASAVVGGIALIGMTGSGKWEYTLDGSTYVTISSVSAGSALLLPKTATLRYTPNGKNSETATIVYRAWDKTSGTDGGRADLSQTSSLGDITAFSTASDTATLSVTDVNDAPVLVAATPALGSVVPGGVKTIALTGTFINFNSGSTTITDVDSSAVLGGIALVGITGSGTWEYSTDGTTFTSVGTISASSALLLPKNATLRYTAGSALTDSPSITYRAWDTTSGTSGSKVDLSASGATGGSTAFSAVTDTASLVVASGSLSGYVYVNSNNDGTRNSSNGNVCYGLPGVPVKLLQYVNSAWSEVAGKSPVLTGADGSYHFDSLVAGTYRIQEVQPASFIDGKETVGKVGGTAKGTAGADSIDITLGAGEVGTEYNFGEVVLKPQKLSLRMFLFSAASGAQAISQLDDAPVLDLATSLRGSGFTTLLPASGSSAAIANSDAAALDTDSSMLAGMTVVLVNPLDGANESLSATVTNTNITSTYANGVLTLSGVADAATYTQVLKSIKYTNTASSPQTSDRIINLIANDGILNSLPVTARLTSTQASANAAADSLFSLTSDWLSS